MLLLLRMESKDEIDDDCLRRISEHGGGDGPKKDETYAWCDPLMFWRALGEYGPWYLFDISTSGETIPLAFGEWELERGAEGLDEPEEMV